MITPGVARPWISKTSVMAANAPPAMTARVSRRRKPASISATLAVAAIPEPMAMMKRCWIAVTGALSSLTRKCITAAGTAALAAMSVRLAPKRLRSRRSTPVCVGRGRGGLSAGRQRAAEKRSFAEAQRCPVAIEPCTRTVPAMRWVRRRRTPVIVTRWAGSPAAKRKRPSRPIAARPVSRTISGPTSPKSAHG